MQPDRPDELERIENSGGKVINWNGQRVLGVLATSRSIGTLKTQLIALAGHSFILIFVEAFTEMDMRNQMEIHQQRIWFHDTVQL